MFSSNEIIDPIRNQGGLKKFEPQTNSFFDFENFWNIPNLTQDGLPIVGPVSKWDLKFNSILRACTHIILKVLFIVNLTKQNVYSFIKVVQLLNICKKKHHQSFSYIKSTYVKHFEILLQQEIVMAHGHRHIILY